ncbi:MAG TPA: UDP-4-amino-4,6-dideoxy-N-acetyl-beta-L-altrosamine N-acetyltransferase [Polyangia bacterium]|jgi:UDP-4-amino-4,6-dideoxy-N-acetyl-beta-L-altrosamine N-acetyltransferase|nr:UDP-4-amino-4,6-dideoxy-N-acetyl-beta-L-altrosamine N-acetyltransferase [Polyangia bacterium]
MFTLRPLSAPDLPLILPWRNRRDVRELMYTQHVISPAEHAAWFARLRDDATKRYFVCERDGEPVGVVGFYAISREHASAEWGFYTCDPGRRGLGTPMAYLALQEAFGALALRKVCAEVLDVNPRGLQFHRRLGFVDEGVRRQHVFVGGQYRDVYLLALFGDAWRDGLAAQLRQRLDDNANDKGNGEA